MPARLALLAVLVLLVAAGAVLRPGPSDAAALSPAKVCGPGFAVIDQQRVQFRGGGLAATAYLLYDNQSGRNCSVTVKRIRRGHRDFMTAFVQRRGGEPRVDAGRFELYAAPVYVHAPGRCVRFGAKLQVAGRVAGGYSLYGHCGR